MNEAPRSLTKRQLLIGLAFAAASLGALYIVLPNLAAFGMTANLLLLPGSIGYVEGGMIAFTSRVDWRSSPSSPTAPTPSGCRRFQARSPTSASSGTSRRRRAPRPPAPDERPRMAPR